MNQASRLSSAVKKLPQVPLRTSGPRGSSDRVVALIDGSRRRPGMVRVATARRSKHGSMPALIIITSHQQNQNTPSHHLTRLQRFQAQRNRSRHSVQLTRHSQSPMTPPSSSRWRRIVPGSRCALLERGLPLRDSRRPSSRNEGRPPLRAASNSLARRAGAGTSV